MQFLTEFLWRKLNAWVSARGLLPAPNAKPGDFSPDFSAPIFRTPGRKFLHVGCGHARKANAGPGFQSDDWIEVRLDIDPAAQPDIVGSMVDMSAVPTESVDGVFSSHSLEHIYAHELPIAMAEMRRVLKPEGVIVVTVPDLQSTARMIAEDRLLDTAYVSPGGPITPFDILYGYREYVGQGLPYMAHHGGFTLTTLMAALKAAQFSSIAGKRREALFDLWVLATKTPIPEEKLKQLASRHLPA